MFKSTMLKIFGLSGLLGIAQLPETKQQVHLSLMRLHLEQVKLLKIQFGQPGLCTEWDRDYHAPSKSCGKRGKLTKRWRPRD